MTSRLLVTILLAHVALAALCLFVFLPGLSGGFLFDDFPNLVHLQGWKIARLDIGSLSAAMWSGQTSDGGRPLAMLSFALNHAASGPDPYWLKATSLALHFVNGWLVWRLAARVFKVPASGQTADGRVPTVAAAMVAAAWLVHPLQASTVLYIVQRMEIGAAMGVLCALLAYARFRESQLAGGRAWPWLLASFGGLLFGLGFKESAAIAPVLALLVEALLFRFARRGGNIDGRLVAVYAAMGVAALAGFLLVVLPLTSEAAYSARTFGAWERTLTQARVLCMYLKQIVVPLPEAYRFYYDDVPVAHSLMEIRTLLPMALLLALGVAAVAVRRARPVVTFGIAWFFACHAITSSPIPLELAFEHRNYLALLGPLLAVTALALHATRRLHGDARLVLGLVTLTALAAMGWVQSATWGDPLRLALTLEQRAPHSARAGYALGAQLVAAAGNETDTPAWSLGVATIERASRLPSASALPHQALIVLQASHGLNVAPETWGGFRRKLTERRLGPEGFEALYAVQRCRITRQCTFDDGQLLETLLAVLRHNPSDPVVHTLYADFAWNVLEDAELAIRLQREAVALAPGDPRMQLNLAQFLLASGQVDALGEGRSILERLQATHGASRLGTEIKQIRNKGRGREQSAAPATATRRQPD